MRQKEAMPPLPYQPILLKPMRYFAILLTTMDRVKLDGEFRPLPPATQASL